MINFRTRSNYSILYGLMSVRILLDKTLAENLPSLVITDINSMFSAVEFNRKAEGSGVKPIFATEIKLHLGSFIGERDVDSFPVILVAKNENGYKALMHISSESYISGYFKEPRINLDFLKDKSEDLFFIDPSLDGRIATLLSHNDEEGATQYLTKIRDIFGDNFFAGASIGDKHREMDSFLQTRAFCLKNNVKQVLTNEVLYLDEEDAETQEIYKIIGDEKKDLHTNGSTCLNCSSMYFASVPKLKELFAGYEDILDNSSILAENCNATIKIGNPTPPMFKFTAEYAQEEGLGEINDNEYFRHRCEVGLKQRLRLVTEEKHQEYYDRLNYEISVINSMRFPGYMLIVWDFIREAKRLGVPVGPGRGSAAGSLVAFSLEITNIDPMKYGLLFERFLNPARVSMPDIDIDFCRDRREEVINYVSIKYGFLNVAQVTTFGTLLAKGVVKDVGKTLGFAYSEMDKIAKSIPDVLGVTIDDALDDSLDFFNYMHESDDSERMLHFAKKLEGLKRQVGMHAAGIVISDDELWTKTPVYRNPESKNLITQYSLDYLEDVDLIKFDFLGLKTLTVLDNGVKLIKKNHGITVDFETLSLDDPAVYEYISSGETSGMFQIESSGMRDLNKRLSPDGFEDLIAVLALYRPGPMNSGMLDSFIERKHGREKITYELDVLEEILSPTYGVPVYQEQIMSMVQVVGNFSLGEADIVRRAMGKKKPEIMAKYKDEFVAGAVGLEHDKTIAESLFDTIAGFAEYGFNKSHSAAYAMITYHTAWMKKYYPAEFMAALMNSDSDDSAKLYDYLEECKKMGITILQPDINKSFSTFTPLKSGEIRFGLKNIKGVGSSASDEVMTARGLGGAFKSLYDFLTRVAPDAIKKNGFEALAASGAFDVFGNHRSKLFNNAAKIISYSSKRRNIDTAYAHSIFSENVSDISLLLELPFEPEWGLIDEFFNEKQYLSAAVSVKSPFADYAEEMAGSYYKTYSQLLKEEKSVKENVIVIVTTYKKKISKKGNEYYTFSLMDDSGTFEAMCFSSTFESFSTYSESERKRPMLIGVSVDKGGDFVNFKINSITMLTSSGANQNRISPSQGALAAIQNNILTKEVLILRIKEEVSDMSIIDKAISSMQSGGRKRLIVLIEDLESRKFKIIDKEVYVNDKFELDMLKYVDMRPRDAVVKAAFGV